MTTLLQVSTSMVTAINAGGATGIHLFDGNLDSFWFPGWQVAHYPAVIMIDLQAVYPIEHLRVYDGTGQPVVKFSFAEVQNQISHVINHSMTAYNQWVTIPVNKNARFLYVELLTAEGDKPIGALEIYTSAQSTGNPGGNSGGGSTGVNPGGNAGGGGTGVSPSPTVTLDVKSDVSKAFCVNSFHWIPDTVVKPFHIVREFMSWGWFEHAPGMLAVEPSNQSNARLDTHFAQLKQMGVKPLFCSHQCAPYLNTYPGFDEDDKPKNTFSASGIDPLSYSHYARFLFQIAARYGRTTVPLGLVQVKDDPSVPWPPQQIKKTGLDVLEYISPWNEPDKWWKHPNGNFTPQEYAALLSACWDGHEGRILGGNAGIKTADPHMRVVLGGLVDIDLNYLNEMDAWFKANRTDQVFCADIIDMHHYSNNYGRSIYAPNGAGISPEEDGLRQKLIPVVQWRDTKFPNKELWLSEFGYDTGVGSPQVSKPYANFTSEQVQAMWLMRGYLEAIAAGVDRIFLYHINDISETQLGLYLSSGLVKHENNGYAPKVSYQLVTDLITKLKGLSFKGDQSNTPNMRIFVFANADNTKRMAVVWSPTSSGVTISNASVLGHTVNITEMPTILDLNAVVAPPPPPPPPPNGSTQEVRITVHHLPNKHKVTHEVTIASTDEVYLNGTKLNTNDLTLEIRRPVVSSQPAPSIEPAIGEEVVEPKRPIATSVREQAANLATDTKKRTRKKSVLYGNYII